MKILMYGSLVIAIGCIIGYLLLINWRIKLLSFTPKIKKALVIGGAFFYLVFLSMSLYIYQVNKVVNKPLPLEAKEKISNVMAASRAKSLGNKTIYPKIDIKIRTVPAKLKPDQPISLQFMITNQSDFDVPDFRMKFVSADLASNFIIDEIKGNAKLDIFDSLITLGTLKAGESKKFQFDMMSKNASEYSGHIVWQAGNDYIYGEDNKPLKSIIYIELDEEYTAKEDAAFKEFDDLKPVDELVEAVKVPNNRENDNNAIESESKVKDEDNDSPVTEDVYDN